LKHTKLQVFPQTSGVSVNNAKVKDLLEHIIAASANVVLSVLIITASGLTIVLDTTIIVSLFWSYSTFVWVVLMASLFYTNRSTIHSRDR
jgi:hypothetical protein